MKGLKGLEAFCNDLASDEPAPGGGTASAAAGAMAASLLSMVCGITLKNKKHEANWKQLAATRRRADEKASFLLKMADLDSLMYQVLVRKARAKREHPDSSKALEEHAEAVRKAIEVPTLTAEACVWVLRLADEVASVGTRSASSDIEVARLLASAGVDGALANIAINLPYCDDAIYATSAKEKAEAISKEKASLLAR